MQKLTKTEICILGQLYPRRRWTEAELVDAIHCGWRAARSGTTRLEEKGLITYSLSPPGRGISVYRLTPWGRQFWQIYQAHLRAE